MNAIDIAADEQKLVPAEAGAKTPPRGGKLIKLMRDAMPALLAACAAIDADPRLAGTSDGYVEARIPRKLEAFRAWIAAHDLRIPLGGGKPAVWNILARIGHPDAEVTDAIRASIKAMADDLPADGRALLAHTPKATDALIDDYERKMRKRAFGLPRINASGRFSWIAAAEEIGCDVEKLRDIRKARLRAIDRLIGKPGPTITTPAPYWRTEMLRGNAAGPLIEAELARRAGKLPADPLHRETIDLITLSQGAGVTPKDFVGWLATDENKLALEEARGGQPLVQHPVIDARRFDFTDLKEFGRLACVADAEKRNLADPADAGRQMVRALTKFLGLPKLGAKASAKVPLDFPDRVARAIALRPKFGSGWAAKMTRWIGYYDALRSERPLPEEWAVAVRVLAQEVGVSAYQIVQTAGARAENWLHGYAFPSHESGVHVEALEDLLRVTRGTLSKLLSREWRARRLDIKLTEAGYAGITRTLPLDMAEKSETEQLAIAKRHWQQFRRQDTAFAKLLSKQIRDRYKIPFET